MPKKCVASAKDGKPCAAAAVADSGMCAWHAPEWAERRREWSRKGGENRSNKRRAQKRLPAGVLTNEELRGLVGVTIKRVLTGATEPAIGNSVAALARAYVAVAEAGAVEELGRRLAELEAVAARRGSA